MPVFCWTPFPWVLGFIECFFMPGRVREFNAIQAAGIAAALGITMPAYGQPINVTVNVPVGMRAPCDRVHLRSRRPGHCLPVRNAEDEPGGCEVLLGVRKHAVIAKTKLVHSTGDRFMSPESLFSA